jgi:ABC-type transporter MlaC component
MPYLQLEDRQGDAMKKRIFIMFLLLALAGFYAMTANAKGQGGAVDPTQTAQATQTEAAQTCTVTTGIHNGTVNLRECKGAACGAVLDILTEGASLTIITAGEYVNVTTESGVTGWLNSKYCKGK